MDFAAPDRGRFLCGWGSLGGALACRLAAKRVEVET